MATTESPDRAPAKSRRGLGKLLVRLLAKHATITAIESIGARFRLVTLEGVALQGVAWAQGQKLQIALGSSFAARTYTPIDWDARAGRTRMLGYAHGDAPGSAWLLDARIGDECDFFGPSTSLDLRHASGPLVMCGDETSIGLAHALGHHAPGIACLLEVSAIPAAREVCSRIGLAGVELFARSANDTHLAQIEHRLAALATADSSFILTGNAATVQRLGRSLRAQGFPRSNILAKPYWATGRTGLD